MICRAENLGKGTRERERREKPVIDTQVHGLGTRLSVDRLTILGQGHFTRGSRCSGQRTSSGSKCLNDHTLLGLRSPSWTLIPSLPGCDPAPDGEISRSHLLHLEGLAGRVWRVRGSGWIHPVLYCAHVSRAGPERGRPAGWVAVRHGRVSTYGYQLLDGVVWYFRVQKSAQG